MRPCAAVLAGGREGRRLHAAHVAVVAPAAAAAAVHPALGRLQGTASARSVPVAALQATNIAS